MSFPNGSVMLHTSRRIGQNFLRAQLGSKTVERSKPCGNLMFTPGQIGTNGCTISKNPIGNRLFSSGHLSGKVAIVTASSQGIGKAIAQRLAQDGAKVMISSRKEKNVTEALEEIRKCAQEDSQVEGVVCHVGKTEDRENLINETIKRFGGIDILISNAGTNPAFGSMLDCTEDQWDKIFDNNVKAAFLLTKLVVPHMQEKGEGNIVFISSIGGLQPIPMILPYSVSKTALLGICKALSSELAQENIRVNCVCPGIIETNFSSAITSTEFIANKTLEMLHIKRFGQPKDVAGIVSFLCSNDASYITGENIVVGGGIPSRL